MGHVAYVAEDRVGIITINHPSALNAPNSQVFSELDNTLDQVDTDAVRVLILAGAGKKALMTGANISKMARFTEEEERAFGGRGNRILRRLETFPTPVIATVNGFTLGGGCEPILSCDIRVCSDNAVFGQPEAGLGITPGFGGTQRLVRTASVGIIKQLLYTAWPIKVEEMYRIGLVDAVYPGDELMAAARRLAGCIAQNAPIAVKNCKKTVNDGFWADMDKALVIEETLFGNCFETKDWKEGMETFLEKRKERNLINQQETRDHRI